jgi:hypothetical protein
MPSVDEGPGALMMRGVRRLVLVWGGADGDAFNTRWRKSSVD